MQDYPYSTINDAVHGVMSLPPNLKDLTKKIIDSSLFQRLRHIKQMGMADLVFPTATHSRFSHSLGAAYVAYRMCTTLRRLEVDGIDKEKIDEIEKHAVIGALLHDIGHGPFSHAFEKLLIPKAEKNTKKKDYAIKHEEWSLSFLREFASDCYNNSIDIYKIDKLIQGKGVSLEKNDPLNLAADIISSQLDADRLDFVLRDSYFCGVPYGQVDIEWLIHHLAVIRLTEKPPRLGIKAKGIRAVEHFLLGRKLLYQNVCYHHVIKTIERLLVLFLESVCMLINKQANVGKALVANVNLRKFLSNIASYRDNPSDKEDFIQNNFMYYQTLTDYDVWMLIRDMSDDSKSETEAGKIAQVLYRRHLHRNFRISDTEVEAVSYIVESEIRDQLKLNEWEIFVNNSTVSPYESDEDPILVQDKNNVRRIQHYSDLLNLIGNKTESMGSLAVSAELWNDDKKRQHIEEKLKKYIDFEEALSTQPPLPDNPS